MSGDFEEVLQASREGEQWAFDRLFGEWNRSLAAFARRRGVSDVDDVVSEVFLAAFSSITNFRGDAGDFRAWIFHIARNKIADHHRAAGRRPETVALSAETVTPAVVHVEGDVEQRLGDAWVLEHLATLTDEQREVLLLRTVGDLTVDQVASVMGKRRGAVKQLQRRALRRLEQRLSEQDPNAPGGEARRENPS